MTAIRCLAAAALTAAVILPVVPASAETLFKIVTERDDVIVASTMPS